VLACALDDDRVAHAAGLYLNCNLTWVHPILCYT
jgi:hypothetical protein